MASTMIAGAAVLAMTGVAQAAEASGPLQTAAPRGASLTASATIETLTASTDATATSSPSSVTEVVVTGSRIPQPNLKSVSPIQAVTQQEFQLSGTTDAIDLLNTLPQNFQNNKADFSNTTNPLTAPGGVSTADLRALGPQRTLVLVNGRRLGIGDPNTGDPNPAPDLDQIPVALVDHVEVLTGGASATYGSDAVAGVVNFIMKKDFEGVQLDAQYGEDWHNNYETAMQNAIRATGSTPATGSKWDGGNSMLSLVIGANAPDNKGNVTGYFEFRNANPVTEGDRDYSGCLLKKTTTAGLVCNNSPNSNQFVEIADAASGSVPLGPFSVVGSNLLTYPQAGSVPPPTFNSSPYEYLSRGDTRYMGGFFAHYAINSWLQPYMEVSFMNDRSSSAIAPSGLFEFGGLFAPGGGYYVNCGNPFLSAQEAGQIGCTAAQIASPNQGDPANQKDLLIGRRNIEGGPRTAFFDHTNYRIVAGAKGDIGDTGFHYDAYGSYYYTSLFNSNGGYLSLAGTQNALLVTGTAANPSCLAGPPCVPYNIFQQGGVSQAALGFLTESGTAHGTIEEAIWEADVTGDLGKWNIKSPWASDAVALSFGLQHRWDHEIFSPDQAELSGDLSGFSGASVPVDNAIGVMEEYFETRIPIVQKQPFFDELSVTGGFRNSDYSTSGSVQTYKIGGEWAPTQDILLRASYDRAIRAASILEAFTPQSVTLTSAVSVDPCAPITGAGNVITTAATASLAQCAHTGVTAGEYGNGNVTGATYTGSLLQCPAGQCSVLTGGNPHLMPETADTYSIGATLTPTFLKGFTGSIDYWNISINGIIGTANLEGELLGCLDNNVGCNTVVRTPQGFLIGSTIAGGGYIVGTNANVGQQKTAGLDFQGTYRFPIPAMMGHDELGSLNFTLYGTYLISRGLPGADCAGLFGPECQTVDPKWRHTFQMTWNTPWNWLARLQWRYISGTTLDENSSQSGLTTGSFNAANASLPAVSYLDLSAAWRVTSNLTVRGGINNILDTDPPLISQALAGTGAPNAYPTYDLLGRVLFLSGTVKF